jgi:cytochrome c oxidase assembly protein subunit 15
LLVIFQGLLGGARVVFDQQNTGEPGNLVAQTFAVLHGITAQFTFCILIAIALATSRRWIRDNGGLSQPVPRNLRIWGLVTCGSLFLQLLLGAMMRQANAGLAIQTFPLASAGSLLPETWDFRVAIHFAHRTGAVLVTFCIAMFLKRIWAHSATRRALAAPSIALAFLLATQIYLGALVIWTIRNSHVATIHMLTGAFVLAAAWALTFLCHRDKFTKPAEGSDRATPNGNQSLAPARSNP